MNENDHQDFNDAGPVSFDEARQIASRFINGHFKNPGKEGPRTHIPAEPKMDDDIRLVAFIEQQRRASAAPKEGEGERLKAALYSCKDYLSKHRRAVVEEDVLRAQIASALSPASEGKKH